MRNDQRDISGIRVFVLNYKGDDTGKTVCGTYQSLKALVAAARDFVDRYQPLYDITSGRSVWSDLIVTESTIGAAVARPTHFNEFDKRGRMPSRRKIYRNSTSI
jgi:hypothetical protein